MLKKSIIGTLLLVSAISVFTQAIVTNSSGIETVQAEPILAAGWCALMVVAILTFPTLSRTSIKMNVTPIGAD